MGPGSSKWLVAAGALAFLIVIVANLPATLASRWLPPALTIGSLGGTLWHGEALAVRVNGVDIERLEWRLQPFALFGGRVSAHVEAVNGADHASAKVTVAKGRVDARDLDADLDAATLAGRALPTGWAGPIRIRLDELVLEQGWIGSIRGTAQSGVLTGPPNVQPYLGSYQLVYGPNANATAGELVGQFHDLGGPLEISGDVRLYRERRAVVSGWVRVRPGAPQVVVDDIARLPQSDPQGRRQFSVENNF
jgi:hypothetical protein